MRWHTKPITQLVVMFVVMLVVIGAQSAASAFLTGNTQNKTVAKVEDKGLVKIAAPANNCNTSAVTFGQTESNPNNAEPRQPISTHRCEYDVFGPNCFNQTNNFTLAIQEHGNNGYVDRNASIPITSVAGAKDAKVRGMMESIFGFTPRAGFADVKVFEYGSAWGNRGEQERTRGDAPAVKVPVPQGHSVCTPETLYDIGGGEAMVVFAANDRVTIHIGRHEYIVGKTNNCGGQHCSGGYWIYIDGINVDTDIVNAYNSIKSAQEAAGADLTPISLPIVQAKRRLGTARLQNSITMTIWDDGRMLPLNDNHYWGSNFDDGGTPTLPPAGTPTTAPPAGQQCFTLSAEIFADRVGTGTYTFNPHIKVFSPVGGKDGDIMASFLNGSTWINNSTFIPWNKGTHNPKDIEYSRVSDRSVRTFPNVLNLDELTDSYKIKIDNCNPLPNELTIQCKMGMRDGSPFVEGVGGSNCRCVGSNCTAPTPTVPPTNTPVPSGTTVSPTVPPGTSPTAVPTLPPGELPPCTWTQTNCNNECMSGFICSDQCVQTAGKVRYCKPPTPTVPTGTLTNPPTITPPAGVPTITLQDGKMILTFANCNNNTLCPHLIDLQNDTHNRLASVKNGTTNDELFRLKLNPMQVMNIPSPDGEQIYLSKYDGSFPPDITGMSLIMILPDPFNIGGATTTYVIK